jgi:hypothetical protein
MSARFSLTEDLSRTALTLGAVVLACAALLLFIELRSRGKGGRLVAVTGVLSLALLALALARPARVQAEANLVGARVVMLVDRSRRLLLPEGSSTREARARDAARAVRKRMSEARVSVLGFAEGEPEPLSLDEPGPTQGDDSDLVGALGALASSGGERPEAVVVVSDGRLTRPGADVSEAELERLVGELGVPIHTVLITDDAPPDAAVRSLNTAGAAVAHQPLALRIEVSCSGGLECGELPVEVKELRQGEPPALLATGMAKLAGQPSTTLELSITLERAGARVVEVSVGAPKGDVIPDNDRRIVTFNVARQRIRLLHVAGRPK